MGALSAGFGGWLLGRIVGEARLGFGLFSLPFLYIVFVFPLYFLCIVFVLFLCCIVFVLFCIDLYCLCIVFVLSFVWYVKSMATRLN